GSARPPGASRKTRYASSQPHTTPLSRAATNDYFNCREEQYPCTRLYSVHKPCKQCLNSLCFYSVRRMYVINKEICVRTVCAHEELLRGKIQTHLEPGVLLKKNFFRLF
uniref:Microfibril associated protein 2 n=1 Tax=Oryzias melastigma TaxID=30732 RepID=A0A3B3C830_ORYME